MRTWYLRRMRPRSVRSLLTRQIARKEQANVGPNVPRTRRTRKGHISTARSASSQGPAHPEPRRRKSMARTDAQSTPSDCHSAATYLPTTEACCLGLSRACWPQLAFAAALAWAANPSPQPGGARSVTAQALWMGVMGAGPASSSYIVIQSQPAVSPSLRAGKPSPPEELPSRVIWPAAERIQRAAWMTRKPPRAPGVVRPLGHLRLLSAWLGS